MPKHKPLPKVLFVHRRNEGTEDEYLAVDTDLKGAAEQAEVGEIRRVGRYVLFEAVDLSVTVMTTIVKTRASTNRTTKSK